MNRHAFTLLELLAAIALLLLLAALAKPAFESLSGSRSFAHHAARIAGALEEARAYAMAHNTYVWVGFGEVDAQAHGADAGPGGGVVPFATGTASPGGRLVVAIVASADGTRYGDTQISATAPLPFPSGDDAAHNNVPLVAVNKLLVLENIHMGAFDPAGPADSGSAAAGDGAVSLAARPRVPMEYQVGHPDFARHPVFSVGGSGLLAENPTTFAWPLHGPPRYVFRRIIEFSPQGSASKIVDNIVRGPQPWLEIGLQPARGNRVAPEWRTRPAAVVLIEGVSGRVELLR